MVRESTSQSRSDRKRDKQLGTRLTSRSAAFGAFHPLPSGSAEVGLLHR